MLPAGEGGRRRKKGASPLAAGLAQANKQRDKEREVGALARSGAEQRSRRSFIERRDLAARRNLSRSRRWPSELRRRRRISAEASSLGAGAQRNWPPSIVSPISGSPRRWLQPSELPSANIWASGGGPMDLLPPRPPPPATTMATDTFQLLILIWQRRRRRRRVGSEIRRVGAPKMRLADKPGALENIPGAAGSPQHLSSSAAPKG